MYYACKGLLQAGCVADPNADLVRSTYCNCTQSRYNSSTLHILFTNKVPIFVLKINLVLQNFSLCDSKQILTNGAFWNTTVQHIGQKIIYFRLQCLQENIFRLALTCKYFRSSPTQYGTIKCLNVTKISLLDGQATKGVPNE